MNLQAAKCMLMRESMDWNRPHLKWLPVTLYRLFRERTTH